jgi:ABC-type phosphate transport system substrate-binding protein
MSQTEYGWFLDPTKGNKAGKYTQPVEFPAVVGSIAIIMNNDNLATPVALTDAKVCQIFNGQVTTWTGLGLPKPSNGVDTFNLAYRSDGSGTTFSLVNHLANVCGSVGSNHFVTDQSFATSVAQFYTAPAAPSGRFFPANGNPLVVKAVASNAGTIGYSEAANFKNVAAANPQIHYATVNGFDPFDNLPNSITLPVVTDRGISGVNASGVATTAALTPIAQTGCINLVEPSTYATSTTRYPIVAVSYLIANNTGNGTDLAAVQGLVGAPYNTAIRPNVHTIGNSGVAGQGTGFAYVATLPSISSKTTTCIKI